MNASKVAQALRALASAIEETAPQGAALEPERVPRILNTQGAANHLTKLGMRLGPKTVERAARAGRLPAFRERSSNRWHFETAALEEWVIHQKGAA